jgi:hypothetical protein
MQKGAMFLNRPNNRRKTYRVKTRNTFKRNDWMGSYQIVRSKMEKTRVLLTDAELARYVPKTELFNAENLKAMLKEFNQVYVKPDCGRGGKRVIFIVLQDGGGYQIHYETTATKVDKIAAAAKFVDEVAAGDQFIIQQGISLLRIDKHLLICGSTCKSLTKMGGNRYDCQDDGAGESGYKLLPGINPG